MSEFGLGAPWPPVYVAGTTVKSSMAFVDQNGNPDDPTTVTASIQTSYGGVTPEHTTPVTPPVAGVVVKDSVGHYHCEVATAGWAGPGILRYDVTWTGTGGSAVPATAVDSFQIKPTASAATDTTGP